MKFLTGRICSSLNNLQNFVGENQKSNVYTEISTFNALLYIEFRVKNNWKTLGLEKNI